MNKIFSDDQKAIKDTIIEIGFQPTEFDIKEDGLSLTLTFKTSPFYFKVVRHKSEFHTFNIKFTRFIPDYPLFVPREQGINIKAVCSYLRDFLIGNLKPYLTERDAANPWDEFTKSFKSKGLDGVDFSNNSKFTAQEQEDIRIGFIELLKNVNEKVDLTADQLRFLTDRIDFLVTQSKDQTKLTFQFLLYGVVFDLAKEKLPWQEIWEFMVHTLEVPLGKYFNLLTLS